MVADRRLNASLEVDDWSLCSVKVGEVDEVIRSQDGEMDSSACRYKTWLSVCDKFGDTDASWSFKAKLHYASWFEAGSKLVNQIA